MEYNWDEKYNPNVCLHQEVLHQEYETGFISMLLQFLRGKQRMQMIIFRPSVSFSL